MSEIIFDKYETKGAYHWREVAGPFWRRNAYTMGRYQLVLDALAGLDQPWVLDVGCGDGALAALIAARTEAPVYGLDTSRLATAHAHAEFVKRHLVGVFQTIDQGNSYGAASLFDVVVCADVLEHTNWPARMHAEMWRVLKPGGLLIITTPVRYTEKPLDRLHVREWYADEFKQFWHTNAREGVEITQTLSHPIALTELYASDHWLVGRVSRLFINLLACCGWNPFTRCKAFRSYSTQMIVARKPL